MNQYKDEDDDNDLIYCIISKICVGVKFCGGYGCGCVFSAAI
jgi:hypothetical protein